MNVCHKPDIDPATICTTASAVIATPTRRQLKINLIDICSYVQDSRIALFLHVSHTIYYVQKYNCIYDIRDKLMV